MYHDILQLSPGNYYKNALDKKIHWKHSIKVAQAQILDSDSSDLYLPVHLVSSLLAYSFTVHFKLIGESPKWDICHLLEIWTATFFFPIPLYKIREGGN